MRTVTSGAFALALSLAAAQAPAQQAVYRCGQTYQQEPCATGQGQAVEVADKRTPEQRQDARSAAAAETRQARELAAERKAREKALTPQTAPMGISAPRPDDAASAAQSSGKTGKRKKKKSKGDDENPRYWSAPAAKPK
ncbi:MAG: hypothetical protein ACOZJX_06300 [Pseudomonadota bacterium]